MRGQRGQATVEWIALLLVVAVALGGAAVVVEAPWLPRRVKCAVLVRCQGEEAALEAAYGEDVALLVRRYVPNIAYEPRTLSLPVDFRRCRAELCADGPDRRDADVNRATRSGEQATVFTRVVERRAQGGDLYIQYWLYYPTSNYEGRAVRRAIGLGGAPFDHDDDWESYQVRVTPAGEAFARASAHNGYAGRKRWPNPNELPDVKIPVVGWNVGPKRTPAWTTATGWTRVSRGSHAGFIPDGAEGERRTEADGIAIVPIERLPADARDTPFAITPPWRKGVYDDPERTDT